MTDNLEKKIEKGMPNIPQSRFISPNELYGWIMATSGAVCFASYSFSYDPKMAEGNLVYSAVPALAVMGMVVGAKIIEKYSKKK